jgi:hypothetical protein
MVRNMLRVWCGVQGNTSMFVFLLGLPSVMYGGFSMARFRFHRFGGNVKLTDPYLVRVLLCWSVTSPLPADSRRRPCVCVCVRVCG